ncbi:MAG: TM1802 family CRISPR-associated protein [Thermosphaera sp.]
MIDSLVKLGRAKLREEMVGNDEKEALIRLLIERDIVKGGLGERVIKRIIFNLDERKYVGEALVGQLSESMLERYRYVFEAMHPKRKRPRLTFKKFDRVSEKIKGVVEVIDRLEAKGKSTEAMLELRGKLKQLEEVKAQQPLEHADLYTVAVQSNGHVTDLAATDGYKDFLYAEIRLEHEAVEGVCSICGDDRKGVVCDPDFKSASFLKIYITDQPGFISNIPYNDEHKEAGLKKTFAICPDCLSAILIGHKFVENNELLHSEIQDAGMDVYVIPRSNLPIRVLERRLRDLFSEEQKTLAPESLHEIEEHMEESYYMTCIFGRGSKASFKLYGAIREASDTRIMQFKNYVNDYCKLVGERIFGESSHPYIRQLSPTRFLISDNKIGRGSGKIIPIRVREGKVVDAEPILNIYEAILKGARLRLETIAHYALTVAKIKYYGAETGYTVKPSSKESEAHVEFCTSLIAYKLLHAILTDMDGEGVLPVSYPSGDSGLPVHLKKWLDELKYSDWQRSLFLMGYVIGRIGGYQMAERRDRKGFPPILKKISLDGMGRERLIQLSLDVVDAMKDYEVSDREVLAAWAHAQMGLDKFQSSMKNPQLNVFYILTGYAYATIQRLGGKIEKEIEEVSPEGDL